MNEMTVDKTNTQSYEMEGKCPFGGDRVGGGFSSAPQIPGPSIGRLLDVTDTQAIAPLVESIEVEFDVLVYTAAWVFAASSRSSISSRFVVGSRPTCSAPLR